MNRVYRLALVLITLVSIFSCSKELSYESSVIPISTTATGSLKDTLGNCLSITPSGTYYNGIAILGDTNYVQITVDVKTTGNYNIQSDRQNGFQFAGTGVFNSTGVHTINLKGSGTPSQIQATAFTVSFDSTACMFTVNVQDSTGHGVGTGGPIDTTGIALGKWKFDANGHTYSGDIATAQFSNLIGASLTIFGSMASNSTDTLFGIAIEFPASTLDVGTYSTSDAGTNFALEKSPSGDIIYAANATSSPPVLNLTVNSYDPSTKIVYGTFSGQAYDTGGNTLDITNGKFKATVN